VIGCHAGGVPDVIEDGQDGVLVDYGDETGLAMAIEGLLADPESCRAMGQRGRAKVETHYTWDQIYCGLAAVYQELVNAGQGRRGGNGEDHAPGH
jgi:glycosyltransferase involved in cell wall biosynthesis